MNAEQMEIPKENKRKWPWWLWPIAPYAGKKKILRCQCGRIMWDRGTPQYIKKLHNGHDMKMCFDGTKWEFFKMKFGLINIVTWNDLMQILEGRFAR